MYLKIVNFNIKFVRKIKLLVAEFNTGIFAITKLGFIQIVLIIVSKNNAIKYLNHFLIFFSEHRIFNLNTL